ncbi:MAG TPA: rhodanese-like domain-containing protein [Isosphaeraceae bacterium]|nr:rhodanese-like domain-containing protein [Isosphaeraceae bacterium]
MNVPTISPRDLHELRQAGKPVDLIDVRTPAEFRELHVESARLVPLGRLDPNQIMAARNGRSREPLYVICRSGSRARQACERFLAAGFTNVVSVAGGTLACEQAGLPLVRGQKVFSLERQVRIANGGLVVLGVILAVVVNPWFIGLSAFVGCGLIFTGLTDRCGMALLLARMPWNQVEGDEAPCCYHQP